MYGANDMVFSQTFRLDIFVVKSERTMRVLIYLFFCPYLLSLIPCRAYTVEFL